jgi:hypothetical protein
MAAYCETDSTRSLRLENRSMSKVEIFRKKAAEFEELAAGEKSDGLRASYLTVAQSYRRLIHFIESQRSLQVLS